MKKILSILVLTLFISGCSLLPRLTFNTPGTTPQSTEKSNRKEQCKGTLKVDATTGTTSCTEGYVLVENTSSTKERTYTWKEKIINFLNGLIGWGFWIFVVACFVFPGLIGWLIGRVFNVFRNALKGTVVAINNFKSKIPTVTLDGKEVPDPNYVKAVDALLDELENQHSNDNTILKTIAAIRLELKIADND